MPVHKESAILAIYPPPVENYREIRDITLGDLHGNALKLIWLLLRYGVIAMSEDDFIAFRGFFFEACNPAIWARGLDQDKVNQIISKITLNSDGPKRFRFIGDVLADRSGNDWLTLDVLQHLRSISRGTGDAADPAAHLDITCLMSNHDCEFFSLLIDLFDFLKLFSRTDLTPTEKEKANFQWQNFCERRLLHSQHRSLYNALVLLSPDFSNLFSSNSPSLCTPKDLNRFKEHVELLFEKAQSAFTPYLKLVDYEDDEETHTFRLYVHAPCAVETIRALAKKDTLFQTRQEVVTTIHSINQSFSRDMASAKRLDNEAFRAVVQLLQVFPTEKEVDHTGEETAREIDPALKELPVTHPHARLIWNRRFDDPSSVETTLLREPDIKVEIIHGHIGSKDVRPGFTSTDSNLGKFTTLPDFAFVPEESLVFVTGLLPAAAPSIHPSASGGTLSDHLPSIVESTTHASARPGGSSPTISSYSAGGASGESEHESLISRYPYPHPHPAKTPPWLTSDSPDYSHKRLTVDFSDTDQCQLLQYLVKQDVIDINDVTYRKLLEDLHDLQANPSDEKTKAFLAQRINVRPATLLKLTGKIVFKHQLPHEKALFTLLRRRGLEVQRVLSGTEMLASKENLTFLCSTVNVFSTYISGEEPNQTLHIQSEYPLKKRHVKALADRYGITYEDQSIDELRRTLKKIDEAFLSLVARKKEALALPLAALVYSTEHNPCAETPEEEYQCASAIHWESWPAKKSDTIPEVEHTPPSKALVSEVNSSYYAQKLQEFISDTQRPISAPHALELKIRVRSALVYYIQTREAEKAAAAETRSWAEFFRVRGSSADEKISATSKLLKILHNPNLADQEFFTPNERAALAQGRLRHLFNATGCSFNWLNNQITVDSYFYPSSSDPSRASFSSTSSPRPSVA